VSEPPLNVLAVVGSLNSVSVTRTVINNVATQLRAAGCLVDVLDLLAEPLSLYNPDTAYDAPGFSTLQARVGRARLSRQH
jgi:NAD(P)H-dependent FMN reductase